MKTKVNTKKKVSTKPKTKALKQGTVVGRSFTNVFVEIDGKPIPIRELPKIEYEEFLESMHRLRSAYIAVVGR